MAVVQRQWKYLDATSDQIGNILQAAALQPMKDEAAVLLHLYAERETPEQWE